jgi:hypothetical protein
MVEVSATACRVAMATRFRGGAPGLRLVCHCKLPLDLNAARAARPAVQKATQGSKFIRHQNAIDATSKMEQPPTVDIAGVQVPIRGLPENDSITKGPKKPPPKKQVLFCGYCEQACRRVLRCSKCKSVAYCGTDCQRRAWPNHKKRCAPPRRTKSLCACCGALAEVANCDALVAVGASTPCRVCGRVESNFGRTTPSTRCCLRDRVSSMAWSFQAIDATLSP